jgi:hypothetical protein
MQIPGRSTGSQSNQIDPGSKGYWTNVPVSGKGTLLE